MANIKDVLSQAYAILEFTPQEIDMVVSDVIALQQLAAIEILMKDITQEESAGLNENFLQETQEEMSKEVEDLFHKRSANSEFSANVSAAMSKVLADHIGQLKIMGDDGQKTRLEQLFRDISIDK